MQILIVLILAAFIPAAYASSDECVICEYAVSWIEGMIAKNKTEQEIETFLTKDFCKLLPGSYKGTCDALVDAYFPELVKYLLNNEDPSQACSSVGLCSKKTTETVQATGGGLECDVCQYVVGWAEQYVADNKTEAEIETALNKACGILGHYSATCQAIVDAYLPQIIASLENKESPDQICLKLKLCDSSADADQVPADDSKDGSDVECMLCEYLVSYIEAKASNNATEAEIEAEIEKDFCNTVVPKAYQSACDGIVVSYLPQLINYVVTKETPEIACSQVGVCKSEKLDFNTRPVGRNH